MRYQDIPTPTMARNRIATATRYGNMGRASESRDLLAAANIKRALEQFEAAELPADHRRALAEMFAGDMLAPRNGPELGDRYTTKRGEVVYTVVGLERSGDVVLSDVDGETKVVKAATFKKGYKRA